MKKRRNEKEDLVNKIPQLVVEGHYDENLTTNDGINIENDESHDEDYDDDDDDENDKTQQHEVMYKIDEIFEEILIEAEDIDTLSSPLPSSLAKLFKSNNVNNSNSNNCMNHTISATTKTTPSDNIQQQIVSNQILTLSTSHPCPPPPASQAPSIINTSNTKLMMMTKKSLKKTTNNNKLNTIPYGLPI
ncbi:protein ecdysoneless homolog [Musca domestica]|uniref:Protein ecdysoneless homolog n=1 Tax=Musca domestica TaxID=7370 RepID=A0ABM3V296_MUSDO|nr:protein ecdysoneless homolog [Musca domestica]